MCVLLVAILFIFCAFLRIEPLGERKTGVLLALLSDAISGGVRLLAWLLPVKSAFIYSLVLILVVLLDGGVNRSQLFSFAP